MVDQIRVGAADPEATALWLSPKLPYGNVVAVGVSEEDFLRVSGEKEERYEWVNGVVIEMPSGSIAHHQLVLYFLMLFEAYLSLNPIGRVFGDGFVMRLPEKPSRRLPDVMIILNQNAEKLTQTALMGAADICIEVVSQESLSRDRGDKFEEYEQAGVKEYWLIDPLHQEYRFYRLTDEGVYSEQAPDDGETYQTPLLPRFRLHVPTLWQEKLPNIFEITEAVRDMMGEKA